jgi:hypothetical protein
MQSHESRMFGNPEAVTYSNTTSPYKSSLALTLTPVTTLDFGDFLREPHLIRAVLSRRFDFLRKALSPAVLDPIASPGKWQI